MKNLIVEKKLQASDVMFSPEENFSLNAYMTDSIGTFYVDCYDGSHYEFNYFKYTPTGLGVIFEDVYNAVNAPIEILNTSNLDFLRLSNERMYIQGVSHGSQFAYASDEVVNGKTYYVSMQSL